MIETSIYYDSNMMLQNFVHLNDNYDKKYLLLS